MEQNGGSCAGERSGGGGGDRAERGVGRTWPPGLRRLGARRARAAAARSPEPPPVPEHRGLSRLPGRGPPPSPPTRSHVSGARLGVRESAPRRAQPVALRSQCLPARGRPPASPQCPHDGGRKETPLTTLPCGDFLITPASPKRITKRESRTVKPRSPESLPPPSSSRPRIQETPHSGLPSGGCALHSDTPNCTAYRAELPNPPKWVLRPGPALPPAPLSIVKELSAHTSYETRGGGGCV